MANCPKCGIEIKDHPANAGLDALFAEVVMELKNALEWGKTFEYPPPPFFTWCSNRCVILYKKGETDEAIIWKPSTNISHAMEGVEKVNWIKLGRGFANRWVCKVREYGPDSPTHTNFTEYKNIAEKDKLALAITRALILWAMGRGK